MVAPTAASSQPPSPAQSAAAAPEPPPAAQPPPSPESAAPSPQRAPSPPPPPPVVAAGPGYDACAAPYDTLLELSLLGAHPHPEALASPFSHGGASFTREVSHARVRCSATTDAASIFDWRVHARRAASQPVLQQPASTTRASHE